MSRPGGYIQSGEEFYSFGYARCYEEENWGDLSIEAEGEHCLFLLPDTVWQSRTGMIEDLLDFPWPYDVPWRLPEADRLDRLGFVELVENVPNDRCALCVPGQLLEIVKAEVVFEEIDAPHKLVTATIRLLTMNETGDRCQEWEVWLCCAYNGGLGEDEDDGW